MMGADIVQRLRKVADPSFAVVVSPPGQIAEIKALAALAATEIETLRATNRKLNRLNQQLQSDIARDRHILDEARTPPVPTAQDSIEGSQWTLGRAFLRVYREAAALRARVGELEGATCPRPCNNRPDDFTIGQCNDAGECGCVFARAALTTRDAAE